MDPADPFECGATDYLTLRYLELKPVHLITWSLLTWDENEEPSFLPSECCAVPDTFKDSCSVWDGQTKSYKPRLQVTHRGTVFDVRLALCSAIRRVKWMCPGTVIPVGTHGSNNGIVMGDTATLLTTISHFKIDAKIM